VNRGRTLARYTMGWGALFTGAVVASSPWTVMVGGIPTTYQRTGVVGQPLAFLVVMFMIGILAVAYVGVGRRVRHGAPFYAQLAHGLNPTAGLVAAAVAFVGYNALQISLYPLFVDTMANLTGVETWWGWALVGWLNVLLLGRYPGAVNAKVLGVLLALEIAVICLLIAAGFTRPASGEVSAVVFLPSSLLVTGLMASVVVFAVAAFSGVETVEAYAEEAKSDKAVIGASFAAIGVCGTLYCLASWSYEGWIGFNNLREAAGQAANQPLELLGSVYGPGITLLATFLVGTSIQAAMVSFSATIARYVYALAREGVLPAAFGRVTRGTKGGAPLGGSWVQAVTVAIVLPAFLAAGADPIKVVFPWLSTIGAFCILILLTAANWSAFNYFDRGLGGAEPVWLRRIFPFLGGIIGVLAVVFMASSLSALLGTPPGSTRPWLVAVPIGAFVLIALGRGAWLQHARPEVYDGVGRGVPDPKKVLDDDLEGIEV
jgi:amino acid transporter